MLLDHMLIRRDAAALRVSVLPCKLTVVV